jgi:lipopolysaccharide export system protein LptA
MQKTLNFFFLFIGIVYCTFVQAYPAGLDPDKPIKIQSNEASLEQLKQEAAYRGNVIMTQGENILHSDELTVKRDSHGRLNVITAKGKPATFTGKRANDPKPLHATAQTIYYYPEKQLIILEGEATLEHQQDKFEGPSLTYNLEKQVITASSQKDVRPTVILHPRS